MAIVDSPAFSLDDVIVELGLPTASSLSTCFASAIAPSFDALYEGSKDRLSNFRNYGAVVVPTIDSTAGATGTSSSMDIDLTVNSGNTIAILVICGYTSLGTIGVSDTELATWTHFSTPNSNMSIYYCNDLTTTGVRTITITSTGSFYLASVALTLNDSPTTLTGTPTSNIDLAASSTTVSVNYTPRSTSSLLLGVGFTRQSGTVDSIWDSFGSGQTFIQNASASGVVTICGNLTSEYTGSTSADSQSFTNAITTDDKYIIAFDIIPI